MRMSGQLSFAQSDLTHILKAESLRRAMGDANERFCASESEHFEFAENVSAAEWEAFEMSLGVERAWLERREFREWMGLSIEVAGEVSAGRGWNGESFANGWDCRLRSRER